VPRWGRRYLLRNHQKLALADEMRVIIGGFNVEDSYFGTTERARGATSGCWSRGRRRRGWSAISTRWRAGRSGRAHRCASLGSCYGRGASPRARRAGCSADRCGGSRPGRAWSSATCSGARTIDLIAAYFAPNPAMLRRLDKAGKRGRVRLVLPSKLDHGAAIWAARFTYAGLLRKKVQIYEYQPTKLHTKLFVIDDVVHIGSANFDIRSMFLNLELMLRIEDPAFAAYVRSYVEGEIAQSERITPELYKARTGPWTRLKQLAAYFVMAVLDYNVTRGLNFGRRRGE
jgi:cardiolipin synthase